MATLRIGAGEVLRYRARASHLDRKLGGESTVGGTSGPEPFAAAAWGGLQDTVPRAAVLSLHARVAGTRPDTWEDPSLVQIWFRGGADYVVPRTDVGVFTLGSYPRDPAEARALEALADEVHRLADGAMLNTSDLPQDLGGRRLRYRATSITGRVHIRWDTRQVWIIPVERPAIDPEDARRELARRFFHWFAPATVVQLTRWTGVEPKDARATFEAIREELEPVEVVEGAGGTRPNAGSGAERAGAGGEGPEAAMGARFALASDIDALRTGAPIEGVRLLPQDDPFTKLDHAWLVPDAAVRLRALPSVGRSPGYIPGAVLVDGRVVGGWQRQGRAVTIHPFGTLSTAVRAALEAEALSMPIAGPGEASIRWSA